MSESWSDQEFLGYCDLHCRTERAKITYGSMTIELEDASAEEVERVVQAMAGTNTNFVVVPVCPQPAPSPTTGSPAQGYPWSTEVIIS